MKGENYIKIDANYKTCTASFGKVKVENLTIINKKLILAIELAD